MKGWKKKRGEEERRRNRKNINPLA
jgi:hypothetical protein